MPTPDPPRITVIIPVFNGSVTLRECLESVTACDYPDFEVVVVDDCSDDETPAIIQSFDVRYIRLDERSGAGRARNEGVKHATGDIIAFTDADCIVPSDWLSRLAAHFQNPTIGGVGGIYKPAEGEGLISQYATYSLHDSWYRWLGHSIDSLNTGNCAYRKALLVERDTSEEDIFKGMAAAEDTMVTLAVAEKAELHYDEKLFVYHKSRDTLSTFWRQQVIRGYSRTVLALLPSVGVKKSSSQKSGDFLRYLISVIVCTSLFWLGWPLIATYPWLPVVFYAGMCVEVAGVYGLFFLHLELLFKAYRVTAKPWMPIVFYLLTVFRNSAWIVGMMKGTLKFMFRRSSFLPLILVLCIFTSCGDRNNIERSQNEGNPAEQLAQLEQEWENRSSPERELLRIRLLANMGDYQRAQAILEKREGLSSASEMELAQLYMVCGQVAFENKDHRTGFSLLTKAAQLDHNLRKQIFETELEFTLKLAEKPETTELSLKILDRLLFLNRLGEARLAKEVGQVALKLAAANREADALNFAGKALIWGPDEDLAAKLNDLVAKLSQSGNDENARFFPVDLQLFYNTEEHINPAGDGGRDDNWGWVKPGVTQINGIPFTIGEEHICMFSSYNKKGYKSIAVPVPEIKAAKLWVLGLSAGWGGEGVSCYLRLHYADGERDEYVLDERYVDDFYMERSHGERYLPQRALTKRWMHIDMVDFPLRDSPLVRIEIEDAGNRTYSLFFAITLEK